jgi:MobA-like NTP transferase domain
VLPNWRRINMSGPWSVFIMCAGDGTRWGNHLGVSKHDVVFGGTSLLLRTIVQLNQRDIEPTVIVARDAEVPMGVKVTRIESTTCLVDSISQTEDSWRSVNVFLLGDVFYSEAAIDRILACQGPLAFFARPWSNLLVRCGHGEVFAFVFRASCASFVRRTITRVFECVAHGHPGNLWNLHHALIGVEVGRRVYCRRLVEVVDDYTNDIDTPVDYQRRAGLYEGVASGTWWSIVMMRFYAAYASWINFARRRLHHMEVHAESIDSCVG